MQDAFLPGCLFKIICDYSRPEDSSTSRKMVRKKMTTNLLYFSLNLSSRKWTENQGFLSIFLWSNNSKVIIQRKVTKCILVLKLRHRRLENQVSSKNLFSAMPNPELFPNPWQLQSPKAGLSTSNRLCARTLWHKVFSLDSQQETLCLARLISCVILQIISNSLGNVELVGKKKSQRCQKEKWILHI